MKKLFYPTRAYIIAEVASTHEGDAQYLEALVEKATATGADAIKFQIYKADDILTRDHAGYEELKGYELSEKQWSDVIAQARSGGLDVWVDLSGDFCLKVMSSNLDRLTGVKFHSSDVNNFSLIDQVNRTGLAVAIGCGGTNLVELFESLDRLDKSQREVCLVHGFQSYPTDPVDTHIRRIGSLAKTFPYAIGIADHLDGGGRLAQTLPLVALGAGAQLVEKHIILERTPSRDDYYSSLDPERFAEMVSMVREAEPLLGSGLFEFGGKEAHYRNDVKKIPIAARDLGKGETTGFDGIKMARIEGASSTPSPAKAATLPLKTSVSEGAPLSDAVLEHSIGIFVNARLHSTRLPRKALLPLWGGMNTLEYLLNRLKSYPGLPGHIVFATSDDPEDAPLEECAANMGIDALRGSPLDVMYRMIQVVDTFSFDTLVRVTGDDIFVSPEYIEKALAYHFANNLDYTRIDGLAYGLECEVIDTRALRAIHKRVVNTNLTEYITWFLDRSGICKYGVMPCDPEHERRNLRLTLDYQNDYDLMCDLAKECHATTDLPYLPLQTINNYLDITTLNVPHTDQYQRIFREDIDVSLKYNG